MRDGNTNCEEWLWVMCHDCKYFNIKADMENVTSTCKRLDHKHLKFSKPWFASYDCGAKRGCCSDFECKENGVPWLKSHWNDIEIIEPNADETVPLVIDDNTDVRYHVSARDFFYGNFKDDSGNLKWIYRLYCKNSKKSSTGYFTVREYRDGTIILNGYNKERSDAKLKEMNLTYDYFRLDDNKDIKI